MAQDLYNVHFTDGHSREFNASSAVNAWIRGLSYIVVTGRNVDVKYVVNLKSMQIYADFVWDVSFSLKDTAFITGSPIIYCEDEALDLLLRYAKYVGNSETHTKDWFQRNRKLT